MGFIYLFSFQLRCPLRFQTPHLPAGERVSWCLETSLSQLPSRDGSPSPTLLSIFLILYFVLPLSEENGLPFWVPGILCQRSEVVLWNLLSVQMIFWWICGGESDLPVLFLCHLRATPMLYVSIKHLVRDYLLILINYLMVKYSTCFLVIQLLKRLSACNLIWSFYTL